MCKKKRIMCVCLLIYMCAHMHVRNHIFCIWILFCSWRACCSFKSRFDYVIIKIVFFVDFCLVSFVYSCVLYLFMHLFAISVSLVIPSRTEQHKKLFVSIATVMWLSDNNNNRTYTPLLLSENVKNQHGEKERKNREREK